MFAARITQFVCMTTSPTLAPAICIHIRVLGREFVSPLAMSRSLRFLAPRPPELQGSPARTRATDADPVWLRVGVLGRELVAPFAMRRRTRRRTIPLSPTSMTFTPSVRGNIRVLWRVLMPTLAMRRRVLRRASHDTPPNMQRPLYPRKQPENLLPFSNP